MLDKLRKAFQEFNDSAQRHRKLVLSPDAMTLVSTQSDRIIWQVKWELLEEIFAFKVDCITFDLICIGFRQKGIETLLITDEETPGWKELMAELSTRYGIDESSWFEKVAFPAFKENYTVLWKSETTT